jgi:hypothetical protein
MTILPTTNQTTQEPLLELDEAYRETMLATHRSLYDMKGGVRKRRVSQQPYHKPHSPNNSTREPHIPEHISPVNPTEHLFELVEPSRFAVARLEISPPPNYKPFVVETILLRLESRISLLI